MLKEDIQQELFGPAEASPCISKLRDGLTSLGLYELCGQLPSFFFLFHPTSTTLTFLKITLLLKPEFDAEGSNRNTMEKNIYSAFLRYLREVASGRRENISLGKVLQFITGTDKEPVLASKFTQVLSLQRWTSHPFQLPTYE